MSRLHDSTSEIAPGRLPTEVFPTEYGDRALSTRRNTLAY